VAAALAREGFQPLVASRGGRMVTELVVSGGELIKCRSIRRRHMRSSPTPIGLRDLIRTRNIALVHARSRAPAWSALWAARMAHVPFVTTYHGIYNASNPLKRFYNSVMARADAVIANSQWTAAHIKSQYRFAPKHLVVIPRGIDLARFDPADIPPERAAALRAAWGAKERRHGHPVAGTADALERPDRVHRGPGPTQTRRPAAGRAGCARGRRAGPHGL
jgi:glycosyltransferase involved in cell wall biosynthesis